jgi:hypothetical protein
VLGKLLGTDGKDGQKHSGHANENTTYQDNKDFVETLVGVVVVCRVEDNNLEMTKRPMAMRQEDPVWALICCK